MLANIQSSSEKRSSRPSRATVHKLMILCPLQNIIENEVSTCHYYKYILGDCWSELT